MAHRALGLPQADLLVSTPAPIYHVATTRPELLGRIGCVVVDEADRVLDPTRAMREEELAKRRAEREKAGGVWEERGKKRDTGVAHMVDQVGRILRECPSTAVRVFASATVTALVEPLVAGLLRDPIHVMVGEGFASVSTVEQRLTFVGREEGKLIEMDNLLRSGLPPPFLMFVQSTDRAIDLEQELRIRGVPIRALHSGLKPADREERVRAFRRGETSLVATDVASRGLDFPALRTVINFDIPTAVDVFIHRVGRAGRAGRSGLAITFFTESDIPFVRPVANAIRLGGGDVPPWMSELAKAPAWLRRHLRTSAPIRKEIGATAGIDRRRMFTEEKRRNARAKARAEGKAIPEPQRRVTGWKRRRDQADYLAKNKRKQN